MKKMLNNLTNLLVIAVAVVVVYVFTCSVVSVCSVSSVCNVDYAVNMDRVEEVEEVKNNNVSASVDMVAVSYVTFSGYEKSGYVDSSLFVVNAYGEYSSVSDTATVYDKNMCAIGEVYSFGWLWNCTNTTLTIGIDISNLEADYDIPKAVTSTVDIYTTNYVLVEAFDLLLALLVVAAIYVVCVVAVVVGTVVAVRRANIEASIVEANSASMYTAVVEQEHLTPAEPISN